MKFRTRAIPEPSKGLDFSKEIVLVVPDQSLSLEEILERFTRGEELPVKFDGEYLEESDVDLEKLGKFDLVEKAEYVEKLKAVQADYAAQEAEKQRAEDEARAKAAQLAYEKKVRIAAKKLAASKVDT